MSILTRRQERYQKIIADYHLITDSIKINSRKGELIFKFSSPKKQTDTEFIKNEMQDIFDYANKSTVAEDYKAFIEEFLKEVNE